MREELGIPPKANTHIGKGEQCAPGSGVLRGSMSRQGRGGGRSTCRKTGKPGKFSSVRRPAENEETSGRPRPAGCLIDYIRVQVCDLQSTFKTQPCIFSEVPWIDAEPL